MGSTPGLSVDPAAVRAVAGAFESVAAGTAQLAHLPLHFGGACAGRVHVAEGAALREGLDAIARDVGAWSRAASELATGLRCSAARYIDAEDAAVRQAA